MTKKVVLITGCSSGFGLLTAARLSRTCIVYATMRDLSKKQALFDAVNKNNGSVNVLALDVTKKASIQSVIDVINNKHGQLDVLINNAGYALGGFFEDLSEAEIRSQMETNFFGLQQVTRLALPLMRKTKRGKIINLSSIAGLVSMPCK